MPGDELSTALREGSHSAFARWVRDLHGRLVGFARRRLGHDEDALDAVQETFVAAYQGRDRLPDEPTGRDSWLFGIAAHKVADRLRSRARSREAALPDQLVASADTARSAEHRMERDRVIQALQQVPDPFREALVLATVEGLSYREIAAAQEIPVGTVRSRIATARGLLRARLSRAPAEEVQG